MRKKKSITGKTQFKKQELKKDTQFREHFSTAKQKCYSVQKFREIRKNFFKKKVLGVTNTFLITSFACIEELEKEYYQEKKHQILPSLEV